MNNIKEYLEIGTVINKRGLKGEIKAEHYCDSAEDALALKEVFLDEDGKNRLSVITAKEYKGCIYYLFEGIDTPEKADSLRGKTLYAKREDISFGEDAVFISDMIGLPVKDAGTGRVYGTLENVENYGASDVYVIKMPDGSEALMPGSDAFVKEIDLEKGIFVTPIPGIFDDGAEEIEK